MLSNKSKLAALLAVVIIGGAVGVWHNAHEPEAVNQNQEVSDSFKTLLKSAEQGDVHAENNLGYAYATGKVVKKDHKEAAKWFRKAAEQGNIAAQTNLRNLQLEDDKPQDNTKDNIVSTDATSNIPTCDSKQATSMLKNSIENGAFKKIAQIQLLDWDKLAEIVYDEKNGKRECIGDIVLNTGKETIHYTLSQAKSDPSKILIQVEELDDNAAAQARKMAALNASTPEQKQANKIMADCYSQVSAKFGIPLSQVYLECTSGSESECGSAMASVCNATGEGIECGSELTACNEKSKSPEQQQQDQQSSQQESQKRQALIDCYNQVRKKYHDGGLTEPSGPVENTMVYCGNTGGGLDLMQVCGAETQACNNKFFAQ